MQKQKWPSDSEFEAFDRRLTLVRLCEVERLLNGILDCPDDVRNQPQILKPSPTKIPGVDRPHYSEVTDPKSILQHVEDVRRLAAEGKDASVAYSLAELERRLARMNRATDPDIEMAKKVRRGGKEGATLANANRSYNNETLKADFAVAIVETGGLKMASYSRVARLNKCSTKTVRRAVKA